MKLRLQLCRALTFLRIHGLGCEYCGVYWRDLGEHMRKRLEELTGQELQPDSAPDRLLVSFAASGRPKGTRFSAGEKEDNDGKPTRDWQEVAKQIVEERDGKKITVLCEELIRALDEQKQKKHIA